MTATRRRGVPLGSDTTNDPNVSGPVERRDPAMRCSEPGGASKRSTGRSDEMAAATVPAVESADGTWRLNRRRGRSSRRSDADGAVPRRGTVIPTALFYAFFVTFGLRSAIVAALGWTYAALGHRMVTEGRFPACSCSPRLGSPCAPASICSAATSSSTSASRSCAVATASAFAVSVRIGRPLIARFADDFCPLSSELQIRPTIVELFRRLTYLWAAVNAVAAEATLTCC